MANISNDHPTANQPCLPIGVPSIKDLIASITWVIGWFSAKAFKYLFIPSAGTKALLAKVKGKTSTNESH
jgi:hypothetical protein